MLRLPFNTGELREEKSSVDESENSSTGRAKEGFVVDEDTGVEYKPIESLGRIESQSDIFRYIKKNGLPVEFSADLGSLAETYLPHLNQPLSEAEKQKMIEMRREITRRQNEEYEREAERLESSSKGPKPLM